MTYFHPCVIRVVGTEMFIPYPKWWHLRGGTWVDPTHISNDTPRIFRCRADAAKFLGQYVKGKHEGIHESYGDYYCCVGSTPKKGTERTKEQFEIVQIQVSIGKLQICG